MERGGGSRLLQMQARFQQKQMQEREMKIASLYEAQQARALDRVRHSPSNTAPSPAPAHVIPGKVRQMFEERRTKAGIDKSYPLQPIGNKQPKKPMTNGTKPVTHKVASVTNTATRVTNTASSVTNTATRLSERRTVKATTVNSVRKQHKNITNGYEDVNHNHETDFNANKHSHPHGNGDVRTNMDELDNENLIEDETFPEALAPIPTPRSPEAHEPKRPPRRSPTTNQTTRNGPVKTPSPAPVAPPRRAANENVADSRARGAMQRATAAPITTKKQTPVQSRQSVGGVKRGTAASSSAGDGVACAVCGRKFAADRLEKHQDICQRANAKKRKPFDVLKHRLQGTEAEQFIGKLRKQPPAKTTLSTKGGSKLNNNWRQKHEDFINAIRAAKQVQAHINAGGKLSDLPPPPPSENPDYVQCPHCSRRFNEAAAERHIPKCANYQFNKPKPNNSKKR